MSQILTCASQVHVAGFSGNARAPISARPYQLPSKALWHDLVIWELPICRQLLPLSIEVPEVDKVREKYNDDEELQTTEGADFHRSQHERLHMYIYI